MSDQVPTGGVDITTTLASAPLVELCKQAAQHAKGSVLRGQGLERIELDSESEGLLQFSTHKRTLGVRRTPLVTFEVRITETDGGNTLSTKVVRVANMAPRTAQPGTYTYDQFTEILADLVRDGDPDASVSTRD
jgi:hypothetical protein